MEVIPIPHRTRGRKPLSMRIRMKRLRQQRLSTFSYDPSSHCFELLSPYWPSSPPLCKFSFVINLLDLVLKRDSVLPSLFKHEACFHLFVGSSQVSRLLDGSLQLKDLHGYAYTWKNRQVGRTSEKLMLDQNPAFIKGFCLQSQLLPFILAAPDAIARNLNRRKQAAYPCRSKE